MSIVANAGEAIKMQDLEKSLEKAVAEVVSTMLNQQPIIVHLDNGITIQGVSAIVGFGGKVSGLIAMHLSPENACTLASGLLGMSFEEVDEIVSDAMGEIVNMLAGAMKKHACQSEELFKISIPSVVYGNHYSTHAPKDSERRLIGVQAGPCSLAIQLVIEKR